jgi:hypothetical protein
VLPWISADTRTKNANELDVVAIDLHGGKPLRPKTENYELAVVALSIHT